MVNRGKRSALSSTLLSAKDTPAATEPAPPPPRQSREAPRASASPAIRDQVLASKGDASASGFKPWYWSYEEEGNAVPPESTATVMPFPITAPAGANAREPVATPLAQAAEAAPEPVVERQNTPVMRLLLVLACLALVIAAGPYFFALLQPAKHEPAPPPPAVATLPPPEPAPVVVEPLPEIPPTPAPEPAPQVEVQSEASALSAQEIAEFIERGDQLMTTGDVSAARVFYERAAEQGSAKAAMSLAKTYDPFFLGRLATRGVRSDTARALQWYGKAAAGGEPQAEIQITRLTKRPN